MVLYTLYLKNRGKPEAEFYLEEIFRRLNNPKGLTFNCDFRVMRNIVDWKGEDFSDFYGIFNSEKLLRNECLIKTAICQINSKKPFEEILENLKLIRCDWHLKEIYDFKDYHFFERTINSAKGEGQCHHERQN